jgi:hypothetical protein
MIQQVTYKGKTGVIVASHTSPQGVTHYLVRFGAGFPLWVAKTDVEQVWH